MKARILEETKQHLLLQVDLEPNLGRSIGVPALVLSLFLLSVSVWLNLCLDLIHSFEFKYSYLINVGLGSFLTYLSFSLLNSYTRNRVYKFDKEQSMMLIEDIGFWGSKGLEPSLKFTDISNVSIEEPTSMSSNLDFPQRRTYRIQLLLKSNIAVCIAGIPFDVMQSQREEIEEIVARIRYFINISN